MLSMFIRRFMSRFIIFAAMLSMLLCFSYRFTEAAKIKDIVAFEGIRDNVLVGYGLVVGLNGTGDNLRNSAFTEKGFVDFLEKLGINTRGANLKTRNIAAVMVTASLPPFSRTGSRISVNISTLGDAKSLRGGTLVATPLLGADGNVYAVAQGTVSLGTPTDFDPVVSKSKFTPTAGYVNSGAIVERELDFSLNSLGAVRLALKNPDVTTARIISTAINNSLGENLSTATDPGTVKVVVPVEYLNNVLGLLADIENLEVEPESIAKVVIDEASGTIVISDNVRISPVAISQGNLIVKAQDDERLLSLIINKKDEEAIMPGTKLAVMEEATSLSDLVKGLNALAVKTQDLVAILKSMQQAGALQATIEVR